MTTYDFGVKWSVCRRVLPCMAYTLATLLPLCTVGATPQGYLLRPGDQLMITVFGEQTLSQASMILPDGTIVYPLVGKLHVGGETIDAATRQLTKALEQYVRNPNVAIAVTQPAPDDVLVLGDVKTPGKYALPTTARVADAIAAAGGLDEVNGDLPYARVSIDNETPQTVSLQSLLRDGDTTANILLGPTAVVYVPGPTPMQVQVIGNVDKPGEVEVHVGDRLSMAVARAGTTANSQADLSHVRVTHVNSDGSTTVHEYDLYKALKGGDLTSDPVLSKNDVVYVPQARNGSVLSGFAQGVLLLLSRLVIPF
jgi:polysaccharide biosynthesis/export protein